VAETKDFNTSWCPWTLMDILPLSFFPPPPLNSIAQETIRKQDPDTTLPRWWT